MNQNFRNRAVEMSGGGISVDSLGMASGGMVSGNGLRPPRPDRQHEDITTITVEVEEVEPRSVSSGRRIY